MSWWDEGGFGNVILIGSTTCGPPGSNGFTPMGFRSLRPAWRDDPSLSTDITASVHRKPRGRPFRSGSALILRVEDGGEWAVTDFGGES